VQTITRDIRGCFALLAGTTVVCVGKADHLPSRLLAHLKDLKPWLLQHGVTTWIGVACTDIEAMKKTLVCEYRPPCNDRLG
jgi:hypothetical protein